MTAVEWLEKKLDDALSDTDYLTWKLVCEDIKQAKEMEKQQIGYSEEDLKCAWDSSDQNMRFQFSSSAYKVVTFKQWLDKFKNK